MAPWRVELLRLLNLLGVHAPGQDLDGLAVLVGAGGEAGQGVEAFEVEVEFELGLFDLEVDQVHLFFRDDGVLAQGREHAQGAQDYREDGEDDRAVLRDAIGLRLIAGAGHERQDDRQKNDDDAGYDEKAAGAQDIVPGRQRVECRGHLSENTG